MRKILQLNARTMSGDFKTATIHLVHRRLGWHAQDETGAVHATGRTVQIAMLHMRRKLGARQLNPLG